MTTITLDPALQSKLNGLNAALEVQDEGGRTVGYFLPPEEYEQMRRAMYAHVHSLFTDEELARAEQDEEEYSTEEVLKHLGQL